MFKLGVRRLSPRHFAPGVNKNKTGTSQQGFACIFYGCDWAWMQPYMSGILKMYHGNWLGWMMVCVWCVHEESGG